MWDEARGSPRFASPGLDRASSATNLPRLASRMSASSHRIALGRELEAVPLPEHAVLRIGDSATSPREDLLLDESEPDGRSLRATRDWFQMVIPGTGSFEVSGGNDVLLVPEPSCEPADIAPYLEGTAAAVLLAQRGRFALHATAVRAAGLVVAICGPRGAGKSTTAMRLIQCGHALLADDFSPLQFSETEVLLQGTGRRPRVTPETVAKLGLDLPSGSLQRVDGKLILPKLPRTCVRLDLIIDLGVAEASSGVEISDLKGLNALVAVEQNAYLAGVMQTLWRGQLLQWAARVSNLVPVAALRRPEGGSSIDEVATVIKAALERLSREATGYETDSA